MRFIIVTGMSGAGKSAVVDALEDVGVYCVDNIPPALIPKFAYLGSSGTDSSGIDRVALVVDARGLRSGLRGENFIKELTGSLSRAGPGAGQLSDSLSGRGQRRADQPL